MTAREVDARMRRDRRLAEVTEQIARAERLAESPAFADAMRAYLPTLEAERDNLVALGARRPY